MLSEKNNGEIILLFVKNEKFKIQYLEKFFYCVI